MNVLSQKSRFHASCFYAGIPPQKQEYTILLKGDAQKLIRRIAKKKKLKVIQKMPLPKGI